MRYRTIRSALLAGGAFALSASAPLFAAHQNVAAPTKFEAPVKPMVLTRELRRSIGRDKQVVSRRSYLIRFVREASGWRVDGDLIDTAVEAPAELAALAQLEKARKDVGLFPLHLDRNGMIIAQQGASDSPTSAQARTIVAGTVERIGLAPADKAATSDMVQRIGTQSREVGGNWPADLFRPSVTSRTETRPMPLPGGGEGRVTVTMQASPDRSGVLEQFQREVLTELGGTSRMSRETWTLSASR